MTLAQVLVVDDSDPDLLYTRIVIESVRLADQVLPFGTGQEALAYLRRPEGHRADLVLLDINMPEMNGFEFLDAYQQLAERQQARAVVVMLTSSPDPTDRARAATYPCVRGYIVKPIDVAAARALLALVGEVG
jgi:CheY-like chemotaxis protein